MPTLLAAYLQYGYITIWLQALHKKSHLLLQASGFLQMNIQLQVVNHGGPSAATHSTAVLLKNPTRLLHMLRQPI